MSELSDSELDELLRRALQAGEPPPPTQAELDAGFARAWAAAAAAGPDDPCLVCEGQGCELCNYGGEHTAVRPAYRPNRPD